MNLLRYNNDIHIGSRVKIISKNEEGIVTDMSKNEYYVEIPSYKDGYICVNKADVKISEF
ncbi:hypothetical protein [Paraclostridium bifermentans]|uniref:hypothetical protein n=1 Tax=Paraclostridium bifermentans TaxID=1490 RepID=UPI00374EE90D